jgi:hypothetical protein
VLEVLLLLLLLVVHLALLHQTHLGQRRRR